MECINQKFENLYEQPQACTTIYIAQAVYSKADCLCRQGICVNRNLDNNRTYTEEDSIMIAKAFLESTTTYSFDGYGIKFIDSTILRCEQCWNVRFSFTSRYSGYGGRIGQNLLPNATSHIAVISMVKGRVSAAIIDNVWDSVKDEQIVWPTEKQISPDKFCESDVDCACGRSLNTGGCFYGNAAFVDETSQCPDFCSGIGANLEVRCIDNECQQVQSQ
jgi:hypothetical protein